MRTNVFSFGLAILLLRKCLSVGSVVVGVEQELCELNPAAKQQLEIIKDELNFADWKDMSRNGRVVLLPNLNVAAMMPSDITCMVEHVESAVPAYRVTCTRRNATDQSMVFNVWLCSSVENARELIMRRFINVSAPLPYLKKMWANKKIPYGDKNFGEGCWVVGNLVFELTDGGEHEELVNYVFGAIDMALNHLPSKTSGGLDDVGITVTVVEVGDHEVLLSEQDREQGQIIISCSVGQCVRILKDGSLRVTGKKGETIDVLLLQPDKESKLFQHVIGSENRE